MQPNYNQGYNPNQPYPPTSYNQQYPPNYAGQYYQNDPNFNQNYPPTSNTVFNQGNQN